MAKKQPFVMHRHFLNEAEVKGYYLATDVYEFLNEFGVVQAPSGEFVVGDGHGIDFILHFDSQGRLKIGEWCKAHKVSAGECICVVICEKRVMFIDGSHILDPLDPNFSNLRKSRNFRLPYLDFSE